MKIKIFGSICRNKNHKHIFAQHNRTVVKKYGKVVKVIRFSDCK